jgi:hypothetical protein
MFKILSICAALVLAAAAFSDSAEARKGGYGGVGGGHVRTGGGNFGAARVGSIGGVRSMGAPGRMSYAPGRYGTLSNRGIYRAGVGTVGGRGIYRTGVASGYGQWQGKGNWSGGGYKHAYWYGGRRHYGGGYWPWWGAGAGLALAATWPYYGGYGYADYGYDDCVQWRPDWGWVNVCGDQYGGYYPY